MPGPTAADQQYHQPAENANLVNVITLAALIVLALATARATRIVSIDEITAPARVWIDQHLGKTSKISKLIWCYWCSAWWVSLLTSGYALTLAAAFTNLTWTQAALIWPLLSLANAYAASWILDKEIDDGVSPR
jgi:hypothetical protein